MSSLGVITMYAAHALFEDIVWIPEIMIPLWVFAARLWVVDRMPEEPVKLKIKSDAEAELPASGKAANSALAGEPAQLSEASNHENTDM